jgi:Tol biopolymer transport system component
LFLGRIDCTLSSMNPNETNETPLESWKEIGAYLQRNEVTARRWEKKEGLPVHRHAHQRGSSVYAYPSEIDAWRESRKVVPEPAPPRPLWKMPAFALLMAMSLVMVGNGLRPPVASAQASAPVAKQVWSPGGYDRVSVDGRYAPFTDWELKGMGIHDLETGANLHIATGDQDGESPVLSPDNSLIVYTFFDRARNGFVLRLANVYGDPRPRDLIKGEPAGYVLAKGWTPDGKQVLFTEQANDGIWQVSLVQVADGKRRVLRSLKWGSPEASISPDGRWIAYSTSAEKQPNEDIFVLAADGSGEAPVVQHPANDGGMVWSSDGGHLLFTSDRTGTNSLWQIPMKDGKPAGPAQLVKADLGARLLGMGRNGRLFYYVGAGNYLNVYRADLGPDGKVAKAPVIATDSFVNTNKGGDISPDGKMIAYYSARPQLTVVVKLLETGEERVIPTPRTVTNQFLRGPSWFPDSQSLLVPTTDNSRPGTIHWRINISTGPNDEILRGLPGNNFVPAPVGNVFYSREGPDVLVRRDLDSGEVTKRPIPGPWFSVSPDGKQIAYIGGPQDLEPGERFIGIVPVSGGEPRIVHRSPSRGGPDRANTLEWSPDQKYLYFVLGEGGSMGSFEGQPYQSVIWRIPAAGGAAERVITMNGNVKSPFLHPDGKRLFFTVEGADPSEVWTLENFLPSGK